MLFKRYADPIALLATYEVGDLIGFFGHIFESQSEEKLWEVWVNKDIELSFEDFKKKSLKKSNTITITKQEEEEAISKAEQILQIKEFVEVGEV